MATLAELLANTGLGDKVWLRSDGGFNVLPSEIVDDPRDLLPRAPLLKAYCQMYLGEPISPLDIDAAAQALPDRKDDVRTVLEGYADYFGGPVQAIMNPLLRQSFLDTVARRDSTVDGLDLEAIFRRDIFGITAASIISQVE